jgi:hypothetical protein
MPSQPAANGDCAEARYCGSSVGGGGGGGGGDVGGCIIIELFDEPPLQAASSSAAAIRYAHNCADLHFIPATTPVSKAFRKATVAQQWRRSQCRKSRYHEILRSKTLVVGVGSCQRLCQPVVIPAQAITTFGTRSARTFSTRQIARVFDAYLGGVPMLYFPARSSSHVCSTKSMPNAECLPCSIKRNPNDS